MSGARWISIEGVECAGKTSLARYLSVEYQKWSLLPEFSGSEIGRHLAGQVAISPHFINHTPLAQSLLFLADHADIAGHASSLTAGDSTCFVQDRGYLSKFVYQALVLRETIGEEQARDLLRGIFKHIPRPDVIVLLDPAEPIIWERFLTSSRGLPDTSDRDFILEASALFRAELQALPELDGVLKVHLPIAENVPTREIAQQLLEALDAV